jgi:hypothetical protein
MAIRECFECTGRVSDLEITCPHCGAPLMGSRTNRPTVADAGGSSWAIPALIGASTIGGLFVASYLYMPRPAISPNEIAADAIAKSNDDPLTRSKYERIPIGALLEKVNGFVGFRDQEFSRVEIGQTETVMYSWKNNDGSNMNATF